MHRDISHFATNKLQGGWSASDFAKHLTKENLQTLQQRFDKLEPLVRVRLLLAQLSLDSSARQTLQLELEKLTATAKEDKDEWVNITAKALAGFDGPLDLDSVLAGSAYVKKTVTDLERLAETGDSTGFRPLEVIIALESYLHPSLVDGSGGGLERCPDNTHFTPRDNGASCLPDLMQRATASAAAATACSRGASAPASPAPASLPITRHPDMLQAQTDAASGPQPSASGATSIPRPSAGVDMFRSSRPALPPANRQVAGSSGAAERRRDARQRNIKLLDVDEVKKLSRHLAAASPDHQPSNGHARKQRGDEEMEEGELEEGEVADESAVSPNRKKLRHL